MASKPPRHCRHLASEDLSQMNTGRLMAPHQKMLSLENDQEQKQGAEAPKWPI